MNFEDMTWKEIEEKLKDTQTILVPLSPLEQHGPHLPVSTDYFRGYEVCKRAAEKTNVFCLPPMIMGLLNKMYNYPGAVSVSPATLEMFVKDICKSLKKTGFKKIIIISGHGGSHHPAAIKKALEKMGDKNIKFFKVSDLVDEELKERLFEIKEDKHAGEKETSEMIYLAEEKVKMNKAVSSFPKYPKDIIPEDFKKINPTGVMGDATKATKKKERNILKLQYQNLLR